MTCTTKQEQRSLASLSGYIFTQRYPAGAHQHRVDFLPFCSLQIYPKCDTGAGHDLSQEPRSHAALHHADHGYNAQTGKPQGQQRSIQGVEFPPAKV